MFSLHDSNQFIGIILMISTDPTLKTVQFQKAGGSLVPTFQTDFKDLFFL